ncbi:hypothetical protein EBZ39_18910, partial [bacterium]|nr:hypothetical protein [bacterium]
MQQLGEVIDLSGYSVPLCKLRLVRDETRCVNTGMGIDWICNGKMHLHASRKSVRYARCMHIFPVGVAQWWGLTWCGGAICTCFAPCTFGPAFEEDDEGVKDGAAGVEMAVV